MNRSVVFFLLMALVSFLLASTFAGLISYLLPSPSEFIALLIAGIPLLFITIKVSDYKRWPVAVFAVLLLVLGMSNSMVIKKITHVSTAKSALNVSVLDQEFHNGYGHYMFSDSRLDFSKTAYELVGHYGEHHYYAVPVVSNDTMANDSSIVFWAWCRTKRAKSEQQLQRILSPEINYGTTLRNTTVRRNVEQAIQATAIELGLNTQDPPIILDWGQNKNINWMIRLFNRQLLYFVVLLLLAVTAEIIITRWRKEESEVEASSATP